MSDTSSLTFITGNKAKAELLARYLDYPITHKDIDLIEIQSLDVQEVAVHKAKEAYAHIKSPVLIEDTSLEFNALGKLPGTLIKWFLHELGNDGLCTLLNQYSDKRATCIVMFVLYDGKAITTFSGEMKGMIATKPKGTGGFGWDPIFISEGYVQTRGEMSRREYDATSPRRIATEKLSTYLHR
ncbi:MAG: non-canonical purine NTP pyrophosphatase [Candidatus Roizmanbacteria bacterium]|nr:non-canonical purine NTP pyrophosphatase [Candidatus Roizmanbacteria bacterium]